MRKVRQGGRDLANLPAVAPGDPARDGTLGDLVDSNAGLVGEPLLAPTDLFDRVVCDRELARLRKAEEKNPIDGGSGNHDSKVDKSSPIVKTNPPIQFISPVETGTMIEKEWQKRPWFLKWVEDARAMLKASGGKGTYADGGVDNGVSPKQHEEVHGRRVDGSKAWTGSPTKTRGLPREGLPDPVRWTRHPTRWN